MTSLQSIRSAWSELAEGYDVHVTPSNLRLGERVVEQVGVAAGDRFLDVAAGSGALSIPAARRGADVLATDLSPEMLARLAQRAADEGLHTIRTRPMDGHALELDDETFDVAGSQFGVMLLPDLPRALAEMHRVLRPGGRSVVVTFGPPAEVEFLSFFLGAIRASVPGFDGLPANPPPLEFQVSDLAVLKGRLEEAGFDRAHVERVSQPMTFSTADALWSWLANSNPIGRRLTEGLSADQQRMVRDVLAGMLRERAGGGGGGPTLSNQINIGIGVKDRPRR